MIRLKIPDHYIDGFKTLALTSETELKKLEEFVYSYKQENKPDILARELIATELLSPENADDISKVLIGFFSLLESGIEENDNDLTKSLIESIRSNFSEDEKEIPSDQYFEILEAFFIQIATHSQLRMRSKATILGREYKQLFRGSRIITDIRPIFEVNEIDTECSFIVHQLKVEWIDDSSELKSEYFAMDSIDLLELKKQIERALSKENKIKEKLNESFHFIELD